MYVSAKFPKRDDVTLEIVNSENKGEIILTLEDKVLNQVMTYAVKLEDFRLALRKLAAK